MDLLGCLLFFLFPTVKSENPTICSLDVNDHDLGTGGGGRNGALKTGEWVNQGAADKEENTDNSSDYFVSLYLW